MLLYTTYISNRLRYIVDFIGKELFDEPIGITDDKALFLQDQGPRWNYSDNDFLTEAFYLKATDLLFEKGIREQPVECIEYNYKKAFFTTQGDLPFDILAASFYLISRYEEYLPVKKDAYGRYPHTASLAWKKGFLKMPLVNLWIEDLRKSLLVKFPSLIFKKKTFKALVTYDIDMAWSYLHKGFWRNTAGMFRSFLQGNFSQIEERWQVLRGRRKDPFDCFEWLDALHLYCRLQPAYFFLVARKRGKYDKNSKTSSPAFRKLIEYYAQTYKAGLHPSWQSGDDEGLLKEEKEWLEVVADRPVNASRQHYLRFNLPEGYRRLLRIGITREYSMGYGTINGFRASCCSSFHWYDLEKEEATAMLLYPFCFMDATSFFKQKDQPEQAYRELIDLYEQVKRVNGVMVGIWHNYMLGSDPLFKGWPQMFELFMKETLYWDAYYDAG